MVPFIFIAITIILLLIICVVSMMVVSDIKDIKEAKRNEKESLRERKQESTTYIVRDNIIYLERHNHD